MPSNVSLLYLIMVIFDLHYISDHFNTGNKLHTLCTYIHIPTTNFKYNLVFSLASNVNRLSHVQKYPIHVHSVCDITIQTIEGTIILGFQNVLTKLLV